MEASTRKIVLPLIVAVVACLVVAAVILGPGRSTSIVTETEVTQADGADATPAADGEAPVKSATTEAVPSRDAGEAEDTGEGGFSVSGSGGAGGMVAGDRDAVEAPKGGQLAGGTSGGGGVEAAAGQEAPTTASDVPASVDSAADLSSDATAEAEPPEQALPPLAEREEGWGKLVARAPSGTLAQNTNITSLGSLDPTLERLQIEFATSSAGISRIVFSNFWRSGEAKRQAALHARAVERGSSDPPPMPPEDERYVLQTASTLNTAGGKPIKTPILAVHSLEVEGWGERPQVVGLFSGNAWSETAPGVFEAQVFEEGTDQLVLSVRRRFILPEGRYDITLEQSVTNHTPHPVKIQWRQFGPGDLALDATTYLTDIRRFHFGYLMDKTRDPNQAHVLSQGMMLERSSAISMANEYATDALENTLWPNEAAREEGYSLSWFGSTNRYFGLCIHAPYDPPDNPSKRLSAISQIIPRASGGEGNETLVTTLFGRTQTVTQGETASWDMGVFAGPLERSILHHEQPYVALSMGGLILYLMSGCCSFCTFAWLANFMIVFLALINDVVHDWGISIIVLVVVVRLLLHPITRRGQISMQRNAKAMGEVKPEIDELKKRYENDPEKLRKEQMRLMQEKGMNPLGCASGMLPMFLQMPIWIALYAVLFFAFELRQQWAFYGFFQMFNDWAFMGDLSAPDNFIDFGISIDLWFFDFSGINILPILMGMVFYVQQKYMTPPPSATMTEDQLKQQKMMKIMMLVLFPVMLYGAPSGLTLYILTSSVIGTLESRYIRRHIKELEDKAEADPEDSTKANAGGKKKQDRMGKMYEKMLEGAQQRQDRKKQKTKTYKKR